jgi:hypothetical protein
VQAFVLLPAERTRVVNVNISLTVSTGLSQNSIPRSGAIPRTKNQSTNGPLLSMLGAETLVRK